MLKMVAQFIISGSVVVFASYISPRLGQKWAGLIVAAPLLTLLTYIFLSMDNGSASLHEYLLSALLFMIPAAVFIMSLLIFSGKLHFVANILVSTAVFALVVLVMRQFKIV